MCHIATVYPKKKLECPKKKCHIAIHEKTLEQHSLNSVADPVWEFTLEVWFILFLTTHYTITTVICFTPLVWDILYLGYYHPVMCSSGPAMKYHTRDRNATLSARDTVTVAEHTGQNHILGKFHTPSVKRCDPCS